MTRQKKFLLLLIDLFILVGCLASVVLLRIDVPVERVFGSLGLWFISLIVILFYYIFGAYDVTAGVTVRRVFARSILALIFALAFVILINYFGGKERTGIFGRGVLLGTFVLFGLISVSYRLMFIKLLKQFLQKTKWLFVCTQRVYPFLLADLKRNHFHGQKFFLLDSVSLQESAEDVLGTWENFPEISTNSWNNIIVSLDDKAPKDLIEKLISVRFENTSIKDLIQFYEQEWKKIPLFALQSNWFLQTEGFHLFGNPIRVRLKRLIDIAVSLFLLFFLWPFMLLTALAIRLESKGPVVYRQIRTGKNGYEFTLLKFRSMKTDAEIDGAQWASKNDQRITKVGSFIRKTRLDELPQLFNILEGSMSLVGPRPERPEFNGMLEEKIPFYQFRHLIHPGLTGWAQILYPYGASIEDSEQKLQYEFFYIKNYSLWLDVSIILKTVQVVLFGKGR